jgi:hypothetical protein
MDALTSIAIIAFIAQALLWIGLPESTQTDTAIEVVAEPKPLVTEPKAMAA